jgi:hypothetical protein
MSGLEPLVALGLACNIFQIVELATKTATVFKNVLQTGIPDPSLAKAAAGSVGVFGTLEAAIKSRPGGLRSDDQELLNLAKESLAAARELNSEVEKMTREATRGSISSSLKIAFATGWKAKKIARLEKTMQKSQHVLETGLLARVW